MSSHCRWSGRSLRGERHSSKPSKRYDPSARSSFPLSRFRTHNQSSNPNEAFLPCPASQTTPPTTFDPLFSAPRSPCLPRCPVRVRSSEATESVPSGKRLLQRTFAPKSSHPQGASSSKTLGCQSQVQSIPIDPHSPLTIHRSSSGLKLMKPPSNHLPDCLSKPDTIPSSQSVSHRHSSAPFTR